MKIKPIDILSLIFGFLSYGDSLQFRCFEGKLYRGFTWLFKRNTLHYDLICIQYMGVTLWNSLGIDLRNSTSKVLFKKQISVHSLKSS